MNQDPNPINVIGPNNDRVALAYNTDTDTITGINDQIMPDGIRDLAESTGVVAAMNQINQASYEHDQQLRYDHQLVNEEQPYDPRYNNEEEQFEPDTESRPKKTRRKKGDQRFTDMAHKLSILHQEKEDLEKELRRSRDEHANSLLIMEKQKISNDIDRVSEIMVQAKDEGETQTYVKANRVLHTLINKEAQTENEMEDLRRNYASYDEEVPDTEFEKVAEQTFYQLSDKRELNSPAYVEWLKDNPHYNSYDADNFDPDLANEIYTIKSNFNKFLKYNKNADFIGSDDYYPELDALIRNKLSNEFQYPVAQGGYSNQGYYQEEDPQMVSPHYIVDVDPNYVSTLPGAYAAEGESRSHNQDYAVNTQQPPRQNIPSQYQRNRNTQQYEQPPQYQQAPQQQYQQQYQQPRQQQQQQQRAPVAPVNRSGYQSQNNYYNQPPALTAIEERIAKSTPMFDTNGRPLSERERLQMYAEGKAQMSNNQGR